MKFLLLSHISPPAMDGGSKLIARIGEYLSKKHLVMSVSSDCLSTDDFINPKSKSIKNGLPVYKFLYYPLKLISLIFPSFIILAKGPIFRIVPFVKKIIETQKFKPDYIIAGPFPTTIPLYANILFKLINPRPKLLLVPCFHFTDPIFNKKTLINSLKKADFIWSLTDYETKKYINTFGINPKYILTLGAGIDSALFSSPKPANDNQNLLYIGNFSAHKGIELLIDSYSSLIKKYPDLSLTLAGHPTLYSSIIEKKVKNLPQNIRKGITIINNFKESELTKIIDQCTILILPSGQESFGLVLLEAMSRKKPVIATDIPALAEVVNKSGSGLVFGKDTLLNLNKTVEKLLKNPKLRQKLGQSGYEYAKKHCTWDKIIDNLCQNICP